MDPLPDFCANTTFIIVIVGFVVTAIVIVSVWALMGWLAAKGIRAVKTGKPMFPPVVVTDDKQVLNVATVRKLLHAAFTPQTLIRFCQDHPTFRPIVDSLGPHDGLDDMVDKVINYCQNMFLWQDLLAAVAEENPKQFARFEPDLHVVEPGQPDKAKEG